METPGIPLTRWFEAATLPKDQVAAERQCARGIRAGTCQQQHHPRSELSVKGLKALELLVISRPASDHLGIAPVEAGRKDDIYILPGVPPSSRCKGSRVASNRSLQWGEQIVKPVFESKDDLEVIYLMAEEVRIRRQDVQEHQGREQRGPG